MQLRQQHHLSLIASQAGQVILPGLLESDAIALTRSADHLLARKTLHEVWGRFEHPSGRQWLYLALTQLVLAKASGAICAGKPVEEVLSKELCLTSPGKPLHHGTLAHVSPAHSKQKIPDAMAAQHASRCDCAACAACWTS